VLATRHQVRVRAERDRLQGHLHRPLPSSFGVGRCDCC
jgi:hypothetical protein